MSSKVIYKKCSTCGEEYKYRVASGRIYNACEVCRAEPCEVCGGRKPKERVKFKTCSEECQKIKNRARWNLSYIRRFHRDPDINKKQYEKIKQSPEKLEKLREYDRKRSSLRQSDPKYLEKERIRQAKRWAEKKEDIRKQRAERLDSMTPAERLERENIDRLKRAEWWENNKERMYQLRSERELEKRSRMTDEELSYYLAQKREQGRIAAAKRRQQKRLRELMGGMDKLLKDVQNDN